MCAPTGWLADHQVTRIGMESISDYWRSVVYLLRRDSPEHCHRCAVDQLERLGYRLILESAALDSQPSTPHAYSSQVRSGRRWSVACAQATGGVPSPPPAGAASRPRHARDPASLS